MKYFHAFLFTAREADIERTLEHVEVDLQRFGGLAGALEEIGGRDLILAARLALGVEGGAQEGEAGDARDFDRILEGQEHAPGRPLIGLQRQQIIAVQGDGSFGHLITFTAGEHIGQRRLPRPVRPHDGVHLPGRD